MLCWLDDCNHINLVVLYMQAAGVSQPKYLSSITSYVTHQRPPPLRGGILADDMGLGKTLTVLSLIASNRPGTHVFCTVIHRNCNRISKLYELLSLSPTLSNSKFRPFVLVTCMMDMHAGVPLPDERIGERAAAEGAQNMHGDPQATPHSQQSTKRARGANTSPASSSSPQQKKRRKSSSACSASEASKFEDSGHSLPSRKDGTATLVVCNPCLPQDYNDQFRTNQIREVQRNHGLAMHTVPTLSIGSLFLNFWV